MRLWQQRSSKDAILPSPVRHTSTGLPAICSPFSSLAGNSLDLPATNQAFSITVSRGIGGSYDRLSKADFRRCPGKNPAIFGMTEAEEGAHEVRIGVGDRDGGCFCARAGAAAGSTIPGGCILAEDAAEPLDPGPGLRHRHRPLRPHLDLAPPRLAHPARA